VISKNTKKFKKEFIMKKTVLFLVICLFGSYVFAFPGNFSEERFGFFNASGDAGILSSIKEEKGSDNLMGSFNSCFRRMTRLIRSLDLNEEQIEKIHAIKTETLIKAIPMGSDLAVAGIKLHSEMKKDKVNEKEVNKLIEEFTKVQADLMKTAANTVSRIKKELTPEQLKKFKTLMQKRFYGKKHLKARKKRNHRSKHGLGNKRNHRARHGMQDNDNARHGMQGNNRICRDRHFRHHSDVERYKGFEHSSKYGEYRNKKHNGSSYFKKGKMNKSLKGVRKKSAAPGKRNIFKQIISKLK
jgi:Spy/CpxP family protein refolding chaperone